MRHIHIHEARRSSKRSSSRASGDSQPASFRSSSTPRHRASHADCLVSSQRLSAAAATLRREVDVVDTAATGPGASPERRAIASAHDVSRRAIFAIGVISQRRRVGASGATARSTGRRGWDYRLSKFQNSCPGLSWNLAMLHAVVSVCVLPSMCSVPWYQCGRVSVAIHVFAPSMQGDRLAEITDFPDSRIPAPEKVEGVASMQCVYQSVSV